MTRCNRPVTLIQLVEYKLGRQLTKTELVRSKIKDRPLTKDERADLLRMRKQMAERDRGIGWPGLAAYASQANLDRARRRVERWARRANLLGIDSKRAPGGIAQKMESILMAPINAAGEALV